MKLTFTDQQNLAKEISGLIDSASVTKFKRDINSGGTMFIAGLGREYNRKSRTTNLVSGQQYYQLPEDGHRLKELMVSTGSWNPPMEQIADEFAWRQMNMFTTTGIPTHYFIRGYDELGLYPTPSLSVTDGIELVFAPRHLELTEDDTTTGTVTVTNGSQTITHSGTSFTAKMVNQWFQSTDGTDTNWYRISAFVDSANLTLENYYQGLSGSAKTYRIGQVMDIPEEYLDAPVDWSMYLHYMKRGNLQSANEFKSLFMSCVDAAKNEYGSTTDSQVISAESPYRAYNPFRGDPPASISA